MTTDLKALFDNKVLLIKGKPGIGKSILSNIINNYSNVETVKLDGKVFNKIRFPFQSITENTKLIIIDDVPRNFNYDIVCELAGSNKKLLIDKRGKEPFYLTDFEVIMISDDPILQIENLGASISRRIKTINIK